MKKILISLLCIISLSGFAASKVDVYYFHYSRRCTTCQAVENVTKQAVTEFNKAQNSKIAFTSVNLDEKSSKKIAEKCKADGQSLLIVSNNKRIDLTEKAFLNATSKPDKLKSEITKAIKQAL